MNAKMPALAQAFEKAGFGDVKTVLSSGNVVFGAHSGSPEVIAREAEEAMKRHLGASFMTMVRPIDALERLLASEPYSAFRVAPTAKRVVTFLRRMPKPSPKLPIELEGARLLVVQGTELFSAYVPSPRGPVFMTLIEKTFGKDVTTRTWDTLVKVARAATG